MRSANLPLSLAAIATVAAIDLFLPNQPATPAHQPGQAAVTADADRALSEVARSDKYQWTGVAATKDGRMFVTYPRWDGPYRWAVAEVFEGGKDGSGGREPKPYPNEEWNAWQPGDGQNNANHFVCVQSVYVDDRDRMWVLDPASPQMKGVVENGPKLVQIDTGTNRVVRVISFDPAVAPEKSYLNDVRVDTRDETAFITDSGMGALVVVDLKTGRARRVLGEHPSTKVEQGFVPVIEGRELPEAKTGRVPEIHADSLALDTQNNVLYWKALVGQDLYSIDTEVLKDAGATAEQVAAAVKTRGRVGASDGFEIDSQGNLYITTIESDAITVRRPDGSVETLVSDPRLAWPDSFAWLPDGRLLVTTSQIHRTPRFTGREEGPRTPYMLMAFRALAGPPRAQPGRILGTEAGPREMPGR
jgi:sugar lactone lactonase YvrE